MLWNDSSANHFILLSSEITNSYTSLFEKVTEFISASKDQTINTSALDKANASFPCRVPQVWLEMGLVAISAPQLLGRSVDLVKALERRSEKLLNGQGKDGLCVLLFLLCLQL